LNLEEFAATHKSQHGPRCSVCTIPSTLLAELTEHENRATPRRIMSNYLREIYGIRISEHTLGHHFREGHHKETR